MASSTASEYNDDPLDPTKALRIQLQMHDFDEEMKVALISGDSAAIQTVFQNIVRNVIN